MGAIAGIILLSGCAPGAADESEPSQSAGTAPSSESAPSAAPEGSADYLDELSSESLHEGVAPAAPGTAYIEVAGERFEFESLTCTLADEPDIGQFIAAANGETTGSGHSMYLSREIGTDIGFHFEDEYVQLALLVTEGGEDRMSNSMAQHEREQGTSPEWVRGSGTHPLIRVVGNEATAMGVLDGVPFAPDPAEAEFIAAATCP
ncbi:hypothetical protein [Microbacterium suaedae]|nr:hypothetical protein [Microbacterium suaedae]